MKLFTRKSKELLCAIFLITPLFSTAQVGVGTTTPNGALDITSTTNGLLPPRIVLTATNVSAPVVNPNGGGVPIAGTLVWNTNTAGTIPNNVAPGMYYWDGTRWISLAGSPGGLDWSITGNGGIDGGTVTTGGAHFLGTYDNTNIDIRTNGAHVARISALGEFFIGGYNTVLPGDLMNGISIGNTAFPWAVNGYTDQDGSGVYGAVQGGSTLYAGVQGEYDGTNSIGAGVRGLISNTTSGTDFSTIIAGVKGDGAITAASAGNYKFGVHGRGGLSTRSGGVIGDDFGAGTGALGYYSSAGTDYGVYAFGTTRANGGAAGRNTNDELNTSIGLGVYGGVVGSWVKGNQYGSIATGKRFANYNLGKTITNESFIVLDKKKDGSKSVSYASTSMSLDIQLKGRGQLSNGTSYIPFNRDYSGIIDDSKPIILTITPIGENNGVHIVSVDKNGFSIKENGNGNSSVSFNWIAIADKNTKTTPVSNEILASDFDENIDAVMHNDNYDGGKAVWSELGKVHFGDKAPKNPKKLEMIKNQIDVSRPKVKN
jgi:hypothetical protein